MTFPLSDSAAYTTFLLYPCVPGYLSRQAGTKPLVICESITVTVFGGLDKAFIVNTAYCTNTLIQPKRVQFLSH